jgi:hypothetical protein
MTPFCRSCGWIADHLLGLLAFIAALVIVLVTGVVITNHAHAWAAISHFFSSVASCFAKHAAADRRTGATASPRPFHGGSALNAAPERSQPAPNWRICASPPANSTARRAAPSRRSALNA